MNAVIINPPIVQLNTPYPSGAYLSSFFKEMGCNARWYDLNIDLFHQLFSSAGLKKLFRLSCKKALILCEKAEKSGDEATAFNLRRYISTQQNWIDWIDFIVDFLCDGNKKNSGREKEHQFLFSPFAPRGNRMDNFLASLEREPGVDDVKFLCSYALADLSDYITAVFDSEFALIRYAESVCAEGFDFSQVEAKLNSPVLNEFYLPVLESYFCKGDFFGTEGTEQNEKTLICVSMPFAGTFVPALFTARYFKQKFGDQVFVSLGGGFANTDLRDFNNPSMEKYADVISYDRGYGSYKALLDNQMMSEKEYWEKSFYKLKVFVDGKVLEPLWKDETLESFESQITSSIVPDYSEIDFSRYPRVCDDKNPMHRLWTDGSWVKAYLAHGCYWHKCLFCDTKLDYVCGYKPVQVEKLYKGLLLNAKTKGVYGLHFVDEALPPAMLKKFALLNAREKNPLYFWGNVRFEKTFTKDMAAFLSYCGLGAVSAGLEVATGKGLQNINKGTDLETIVAACAAFKEAGILVHAYMIYGFWYDTPQTIIDSMETLRQFFAAGLLDSAFWHRFVVTQNSDAKDKVEKDFNSKSYKKYGRFGPALDAALESWMKGEKLEMKITKWFDFEVPPPSVPKNLVETAIEKYESRSMKVGVCSAIKNELSSDDLTKVSQRIFWLGSKPVCILKNISWFYLQEENSVSAKELKIGEPEKFAEILWNLRPDVDSETRRKTLEEIKKAPQVQSALQELHNSGIVVC